ncbi:15811_t:CDS:2, partial [Gigaspora rosea]
IATQNDTKKTKATIQQRILRKHQRRGFNYIPERRKSSSQAKPKEIEKRKPQTSATKFILIPRRKLNYIPGRKKSVNNLIGIDQEYPVHAVH